ncbi:MAG TPA: bifunctional glycosyltransferase family 2/GtrA family protein [Puia sp.]|nr:bifunctional glycosyltransferase family 2/GtrA family protein [Puia sp.]
MIIIIPAYNPPENAMLKLIQALIGLQAEKIVIVNDGSDTDKNTFFDSLAAYESCVVLKHAVNLGKGRALKTAFNYVLNNYPEAKCVVTADADGQHKPEDIVRVAQATTEATNTFVMGVRSFGDNGPFRSKFGNILTRHIFRALIGVKISDTQSGLRGIPVSILPRLLKVSGEAYEFELGMLIAVHESKMPISEVTVETVYLDGNASSKFNPLIDSMKIYFVFFRFIFSSLTAALIDFLVFILIYSATKSILTSLIGSRIVSSLVNFFINRKLVFHRHHGLTFSLVRYYIILCLITALSYLFISLLHVKLGINVPLSKIIAETTLFVVSFSLQRNYVFNTVEADVVNEEN